MSSYTLLKMDNITEVFKKKPQLTSCIAFALGMFAITLSAIGMGILIGYTFCYIEHHSGFKPNKGNISLHVPYPESEALRQNRTINGALLSSMLVGRIMRLGRALVHDVQPDDMLVLLT